MPVDPVGLGAGFPGETPVGDALVVAVVVVVVVVSVPFLSEVSEDDSKKSLVRSIGREATFLGRDFFREIGSVILRPKSALRILSILNLRPAWCCRLLLLLLLW